MKKKTIVIIGIGVLIILITLVVQNQQLKSDKEQLKKDINSIETQLQNKQQKVDTTEVYIKARSTAEDFINAYFQFKNQPNKDKVMSFLTGDVKNKLSFQDEFKKDDNSPDIVTKVKNLEIYYGQNTDDRQEIFAHFDSGMEVDGTKTQSPSFVKLDMIKKNNDWKVEDIEFMQY